MKAIGKNLRSAALGACVGAALTATVGLGVAQARPVPEQDDGMVNVEVGGSPPMTSVPNAQATQAVIDLCGMLAPAAGAMVAQVDSQGTRQAACTGRPGGDVVLSQNMPPAPAPAGSPVIPGTQAHVHEPGDEAPGGGEAPSLNTLPTEPNNMSSLN